MGFSFFCVVWGFALFVRCGGLPAARLVCYTVVFWCWWFWVVVGVGWLYSSGRCGCEVTKAPVAH